MACRRAHGTTAHGTTAPWQPHLEINLSGVLDGSDSGRHRLQLPHLEPRAGGEGELGGQGDRLGEGVRAGAGGQEACMAGQAGGRVSLSGCAAAL